MPFPEPPDFLNDLSLEYIYETSLGCVGLVKVWFVDALCNALEAGKNTLSLEDLEKHSPPIDVLDTISQEIVAGERLLEEDRNKLNIIRARLGLRAKSNGSRGRSTLSDEPQAAIGDASQDSSLEQPKTKRKKRRPGERKPTRDPVGASRKRLAEQRVDEG
jgi:hypothetical protein